MTPAEKTRMLAERVMGWRVHFRNTALYVPMEQEHSAGSLKVAARISDWSPLTNLSHAGEVLEAMAKNGWHAVMLCPANGRHYCDFYRGPMTNRDAPPNGHESLSAAICHAALLAEGVKEEEL